MDEPRKITVILQLPQPLDKVAAFLRAVGDEWPDAAVDFSGPWRIVIPPDNG